MTTPSHLRDEIASLFLTLTIAVLVVTGLVLVGRAVVANDAERACSDTVAGSGANIAGYTIMWESTREVADGRYAVRGSLVSDDAGRPSIPIACDAVDDGDRWRGTWRAG